MARSMLPTQRARAARQSRWGESPKQSGRARAATPPLARMRPWAARSAVLFCPLTLFRQRRWHTPQPKSRLAAHASRTPRKSNRVFRRALVPQLRLFPPRRRLRAARRSLRLIPWQFVSSSTSRKIVNRWLALRPGVPPPMDPNPLLWILADNLFNHIRIFLRILQDIALRIARSNQLDQRLEAQTVFSARFIPHSVSRHDSGVRMQRHTRDSGGGAGFLPEKINEHGFSGHGVLVRENADRSRFFQNLQHHAGRFVLENWPISRQTPITVYERIDFRVVDSPGHIVERKSVDGVRKRGQLPRTDMPR